MESNTNNKVSRFTNREKDIIQSLLEGLTNAEISKKYSISGRTVETHRYNILRKSGYNSINVLLLHILKKEYII